MTECPRIFIPENKELLKFVQLYLSGEEPFIRFEDEFESNHKNILEHMLEEFGLEYEYLPEGDDLPKLNGNGYNAVGMGRAFRFGSEIIFVKYGASMDYEIGFNREHFEKIRPYLPSELKFTIEK